MEKDTLETMQRLKIDEKIRGLVEQLWKHNYATTASCEGHDAREAYIAFTGGDGWFEKNAQEYGLSKVENKDCCLREAREVQDEINKSGLSKDLPDRRKSCGCGAGVNGYSVYKGNLIQNSANPESNVSRNFLSRLARIISTGKC